MSHNNRFEILNRINFGSFGNQGNNNRIHFLQNSIVYEELLNNITNISANNIPTSMIKRTTKTI